MRLIISNSYGTQNLGDEAILHAMCHYYIDTGHSVTILTNTNGTPNRTLPTGAKYIKAGPLHLLNCFLAIKHSDLLLIGGGGIIQSSTSFANLIFHLTRSWLAILSGTPYAFVGVGIGPLPHKIGRILTYWSMKKASYISVRDSTSEKLLKTIGIQKSISVHADLAFALSSKKQSNTNQSLLKIGISLRPDVGSKKARLNTDNAIRLGINIIESIKKIGNLIGKPIHIYFLSFNDEQDLPIGKKLQKNCCDKYIIKICPADVTPEERIKQISELDLTIAMRLHCIILSALAGKTSIGIPYDNKVAMALKTLGQQDLILGENFSVKQLTELLTKVITELDTRSSLIQNRVKQARSASLNCMRSAIGRHA